MLREGDIMLCLQKRDPVNFPKSQYDEAAILQIPDFDTFVEQAKKARGRLRSKLPGAL